MAPACAEQMGGRGTRRLSGPLRQCKSRFNCCRVGRELFRPDQCSARFDQRDDGGGGRKSQLGAHRRLAIARADRKSVCERGPISPDDCRFGGNAIPIHPGTIGGLAALDVRANQPATKSAIRPVQKTAMTNMAVSPRRVLTIRQALRQ